MKKRNTYLILVIILVLAGAAALFDYPNIAPKLPEFFKKPFQMGLDLQGGTHLLYEADLSNIEKENRSSSMQGLRDVIERRVNLFGVREPIVQVQEKGQHYRLIVELAGITDPNQAIEMIGQTPFLEFREQKSEEETQRILDKQKELSAFAEASADKEGQMEKLEQIEDYELALQDPYFKPTSLTGKYLEKAELGFDQTTFQPLIFLQFNEQGSNIFEDLTSKNVGKPLAIYIDGFPISAPTVQEAISGGRAQITGEFSAQGAKELVRNLNAGALPVPINLISQQSVGPTLGKISLQKSLRAGLIGFAAIILFMFIFYRLPGLLASLTLGIYIALVLALFKLIPVTLTLAGIGGFILSIGMAIDANILIFSRMKEELREQKSFSVSLDEGFSRAWPSIRDGNLTTLIVALILFSFGSSFVKGFAMTLSIGILLSMFSAMVISRTLLKVFEGTRLEKLKWLWTS